MSLEEKTPRLRGKGAQSVGLSQRNPVSAESAAPPKPSPAAAGGSAFFDPAVLTRIYDEHRTLLDDVVKLEAVLSGRFYGMEAAVRCMMLAALTGESMLMIGPPGTAKSRLIRAFCSLVGVLERDPSEEIREADPSGEPSGEKRYFEYLLTQFTEPSELFGYFDLAKLMGPEPRLERRVEGQMQRAEVVFLDEVFNASSAILNALLTFMNERKFHDRGKTYDAPMRMLFGATNHPPREEGLGGVYDRFLLRCRMENVRNGHEPLGRLLGAAWAETHGHAAVDRAPFVDLLRRMEAYRGSIDRLTHEGLLRIQPDSEIMGRLAALVASARARELSELSNRRLVKFAGVFLAQALLRSAQEGAKTAEIRKGDLAALLDYGLDRFDDSTVSKLRQELLLA